MRKASENQYRSGGGEVTPPRASDGERRSTLKRSADKVGRSRVLGEPPEKSSGFLQQMTMVMESKRLNQMWQASRRQRLEQKAARLIQKTQAEKLQTSQNIVLEQKTENWQLDALEGARVYKLESYTTIEKVRNKYQMAFQQQILQRLLVTLLAILFILTLIGILNPIRDHHELRRILGLDNHFGQTTASGSILETLSGSESSESP